MNCRHVHGRIVALIDGDVPPGLRDDMASHFASCPACRAEYGDVADFLAVCREVLTCPGPAYSYAVLRAQMETIRPLDEVRAFLPKLRADTPAPRFAIAACMVAGACMAPLLQRMGVDGYRASRQPFDTRLARIDEAFQEFLGEDLDLKS